MTQLSDLIALITATIYTNGTNAIEAVNHNSMLDSLVTDLWSRATSDTYANLEIERAASRLRPGHAYIVSDFATIYDQPISGTAKQGSTEVILITAISTNKFSPIAFSQTNTNDILYYDFEYNTTPINAQSARGRITRRIDTVNNVDVYCDFRNILFWDSFNSVEDAMFNGTASNVYLPYIDLGVSPEFATFIFKADATNIHSLMGNDVVFEGIANNLSNATVFETHFQDEVDGISNSNIELSIFVGTSFKINDTEISDCTFNGDVVNLLGCSISTTDINEITALVNSFITNCILLVDGSGTLSIKNTSNLFIEGITLDSESALITSIENINGNSTNVTINIPGSTNADFYTTNQTKQIMTNGTNYYTVYLNGGGTIVSTIVS